MTNQLERTGRRIVTGTWGCAGITMAASAANAALTYGAVGDNRALGLATGIAVDIGLCAALIGDRQLYAHGLSSNWGRGLRITTAIMSLILNVGISLRDGHYFAALLHSFLPVLLVVLCEFGQDVLLQLTALRREQESAQQAPVAPAAAADPVPQLHRPLTPPPGVAPTAQQPIPTVHQPTPAAPPEPAPATPAVVRTPRPPRVTTPPPTAVDDALITRVRKLLTTSNGRAPGRRTVAKQLGISEHQARAALELVAATTGPALNGHQGKPKPPAGGGGTR